MKEKVSKIFKNIKEGKLSLEKAEQQVLDLFGVSVSLPMVEQPILIGHLNKILGYNGFNKIEIGTPVYSFKDRYYFEMTPINGGKVVIQKFYKDTLTPCIDFVSNER